MECNFKRNENEMIMRYCLYCTCVCVCVDMWLRVYLCADWQMAERGRGGGSESRTGGHGGPDAEHVGAGGPHQ